MADQGRPEGVVGPPRPYDLRIIPPSPPSINAISMPYSPPPANIEPSPAKKPKTASERRRRNLLILAGVVVVVVIILVIWNPTISNTTPNIDRQVDFHSTSFISGDQVQVLLNRRFPDVTTSVVGSSSADNQVVTVEFVNVADLDSVYAGLKSWLNDTSSSLRAYGISAMVMRHSPIQESFCAVAGFMATCNTQCPIGGCPHAGQYGLHCDQCVSGLYGSDCQPCPACTNARMRCDDGYSGSGQCTRCDDGYANPDCSVCASGYWGKQCLLCPVPCGPHGHCNDGKSGTGACICESGWSGSACNIQS